MKHLPPVVRNEVRRIACSRWVDFVDSVRKSWPLPTGDGAEIADLVVFRGHCNPDWKLVSPLDRTTVLWAVRPDGSKLVSDEVAVRMKERMHRRGETRLLAKFRSLIAGLPDVPRDLTENEIWALGRHHGLLTPLLDWTESPYVAAFFAYEGLRTELLTRRPVRDVSPKGSPVRVWGLRFWTELERVEGLEVIREVPPGATRQRAQRGLFTRLTVPDCDDLEEHLRSKGIAHCLEVYDLPADSAFDALRDLELMNLTPATLFPDLHGAARQANDDHDFLSSGGFWRDFPVPAENDAPAT